MTEPDNKKLDPLRAIELNAKRLELGRISHEREQFDEFSKTLTKSQSRIAKLAYMKWTVKEISEFLEISTGNVRKQLSLIKKTLTKDDQ